ncbi:unnamed protein product [Cunninghamella blakesleeana]
MSASNFKVLVTGLVEGNYVTFFEKIASLNDKHGPFDVLLCTGNFFSKETTDSDISDLLLGKVKVPLTTYFMDGEIQLPNTVQERVDNYEGEVSENLYYLGKKGIMTTAQGLKIAFLSGLFEKSDQMDIDNKNEGKEEENNNTMNGEEEINKYKPAYYHRSDIEQLKNTKFPLTIPYGVDILLTTEWPKEIENKSTIPFETASKKKIETSNSNISELTLALKPRYHFATSENMFYEREPYDNIMGFGGSSERPATHVSRFIGLGKAFNKEKQRWFYAYNIVPLTKATPEVLNMRPSNTTECPFWSFIKSKLSSHAGQKRSAAEDYSNFFWGDNPQSKKRGGLPPNYVCKICQGTDHFIKDCPHKEKSKDEQLTPPEGYVCKICQGTNHFIKDCPHKEKSRHEKSKDEQLTPPEGYVCKICQKTGHFIKDCPNRFQKPDRKVAVVFFFNYQNNNNRYKLIRYILIVYLLLFFY